MFESLRRRARCGLCSRGNLSLLALLVSGGLCAWALPVRAADPPAAASLSDIPSLPKPAALLNLPESIITIAPPAPNIVGAARTAMAAGTQRMAPGKVAGGPLPKLEIRPAVPTPGDRMVMPPSSPPEVPAKPVLTLPSLPELQ